MHFKIIHTKKGFFLVGLLLGMLSMASGCKTVAPWERGNLADYTMNKDRDPLSGGMKSHVYYTREAASGGEGIGGGGCGCN